VVRRTLWADGGAPRSYRQVLVVDDSPLILQLSDVELDDDLCRGQQKKLSLQMDRRRWQTSSAAHPRRPEIVSGSVANCHRHWQTERRRLESTCSRVDKRRWEAERGEPSSFLGAQRNHGSLSTGSGHHHGGSSSIREERPGISRRAEASIGAAGCHLP